MVRRLANGNVAHGCEMCDGEDECTCRLPTPRDGDFFVMLTAQGGGYTPLMGDDEIAKFATADAAKKCAEDNMLGAHFGFEIFERGMGSCG